ncbi:hypothetical protein HDU93_002418, partial [Gonapodya sp. JEL0774]
MTSRPNPDPFAALASFPQPTGARSATPLNALNMQQQQQQKLGNPIPFGAPLTQLKPNSAQQSLGNPAPAFASLNGPAMARVPSPSLSVPMASQAPLMPKPVVSTQKQDPFSGLGSLGLGTATAPKPQTGGKVDAFGDLLGMPMGAQKTQTLATLASNGLSTSPTVGGARPLGTPSPAPALSQQPVEYPGLWNFDLLSQPSTIAQPKANVPSGMGPSVETTAQPAINSIIANPDPFDIFNSLPAVKAPNPTPISEPQPQQAPQVDEHPLSAFLSSPPVTMRELPSPEAQAPLELPPTSPPLPEKPLALVEHIKATSPPLPSRKNHNSSNGPSSSPSSSATSQPPATPQANHDALVAKLVGMGFSADEANGALEAADGSMENAVDMLINGAVPATKTKRGGSKETNRFDRPASATGTNSSSSRADQAGKATAAATLGGMFAGAKNLLDMSKRTIVAAIETAKDIAAEQMDDQSGGSSAGGKRAGVGSASRTRKKSERDGTDGYGVAEDRDRPRFRDDDDEVD